ncbi:MAG TPA: hypothetical protein VIL46_03220, partial [Gemmataceae bacterium]
MRTPPIGLLSAALSGWILLGLSPAPARGFEEAIDSPMYADPQIPAGRIENYYRERSLGLWLKALARPEAELRVRAADSIARAGRDGMKGLEAAVPALVAELDREGQDPDVRRAVARALVTLGAQEA